MSARDDAIFRMLDLGLPDELPEDDLRALGFRHPTRAKEGFSRLRARVDIARTFELRFADILRALSKSPDPDQACAGLERWLEAGGAALSGGRLDWTEDPLLGLLCTLFACTPALAEYLVRFPNRTRSVLQPVTERKVHGGYDWLKQVHGAVQSAPGHPGKLAALRRARTEAMLQIAALDLSGFSDLENTVRALSDLADACIETAIGIGAEKLKARNGEAAPLASAAQRPAMPPPPPFLALAMGKLGGREVNYSSDIDLVFAFSGEGPTQGGTRPLPYAEYFELLGKELIAALDQVTEDGRCYRVDMRLRPFGAAGPLVLSVQQTLDYLQAEGRTWERQAWLKARPAAGDLALGEALLFETSTFVYRRYLSLDAIGDIQALKRQIELGVARRGETEDEVKLGRGGIRDIEFTVQFLQLLHGGQHPAVRGGHTLRALHSMRKYGLLTAEEAERLEQAYLFMRQVEHRLQLHGDQQVHKLPADPAVRRRVARSMGFKDIPLSPGRRGVGGEGEHGSAEELFEAERQRHVARVREIFEKLFAHLFQSQQGDAGALSEHLLAPQPDPEVIAKLLPAFGFPASAETARELLALGRERVALTNPSRTRKFFASLAPVLLKALAATGEPEGALRRFARIVGSLGGKAVFFQALHENPWLLKMTAELAAWSEYLTEILVANPGLFDELVDALRTERSKPQEQMEAELFAIASGGDIGDTLRAYRAGELLRIGVRDLIHSAPLDQTQRELSDLAAAILRVQLVRKVKEYTAAKGEVKTADGRPVGFAILSVGKFGGREMNYGSDLDVLFFYGEEGATADGLPAGPYFTNLAQELIRAMQTASGLGKLYQLDARLRPNGNKGPLASSLAAFEQYWKEGSLADWERLALTRARFVVGDEGVGERAIHLIRSAVYSPLRSTNLAQEVRDMRRRIEETAEEGDLKRGKGALVDIEFLVQYLQLVHGPAFPPLRQTNTKEALQALLKFKKILPADGDVLLKAYDFFSRMANCVRVVHGLSANRLPSKPEELQKLALRVPYQDQPGRGARAQLMDDYKTYTQQVRGIFEKLVV